MEQTKNFFTWIVHLRCRVSDTDLGWENHTCSCWELWVWLTTQIYNNKHFSIWIFWLLGIWWKLSNTIFLHNIQLFAWDLDGRNQAKNGWVVSVEISIKIIINSTFHNFYDHQDSEARNKNDTSPIKQLNTSRKHSIETEISSSKKYFCRKVGLKVKGNQY